MKTVTIYTDGACSGNPGPGGWCAILEYNGIEKMLSGGEAQTTNNRMELTAVIQALLALREPCIVELYSDSKYVLDALEKGWAWGWRRKGWIKSDKKPALNPDLWEMLLGLVSQHELHYHWVKGHESNVNNNRCDQQAVLESQKFKENIHIFLRRCGCFLRPHRTIQQMRGAVSVLFKEVRWAAHRHPAGASTFFCGRLPLKNQSGDIPPATEENRPRQQAGAKQTRSTVPAERRSTTCRSHQ